jgi:hypothetical protein
MQKPRESVPKTANLLACKQWWKVCFLHGNQDKYYRQIYGRAAVERLASSHKDISVIHPTKQHKPVALSHETECDIYRALNNIDDQFLFDINDVNGAVDANGNKKTEK